MADIPEYSNLSTAIRSIRQQWCDENGYSEPFWRNGECWAFPPQGVIPIRIKTVMRNNGPYPIKLGRVSLSIYPDGSLG